jgi:predicted O-methyltransferase YrrM
MSGTSEGLSPALQAYLVGRGVREHPLLARLREETSALPMAQMQIAPEQGAFMALLAEATGARSYLEVGTFTGYSSLAVALAMPADARLVCCDLSEEWTAVARRYWREAGVEERIDLRLAPALETLARLRDEGGRDRFDLAFIDADKENYPGYYDAVVELLRPGGLLLIDNVFLGGRVVDATATGEAVDAVRAVNDRVIADERVTVAMVPIADGLTIVRKR